MEDLVLNSLKKKDFFAKVDNFTADSNVESVLVWGRHYDTAPKVTILLPTFRRFDLIGRAIKSVLEQEGFDDYQLIIVDNDAVFDHETELDIMVKNINSDKIILYRNTVNVGLYENWNRAMLLAKSEWVCMINDDDVMMKNHLSIMMQIVEGNSKIDFLACRHKGLDCRENPNIDFDAAREIVRTEKAPVRKVDFLEYNYGFAALLLGSVFKRAVAMDVGGIPRKDPIFYAGEDYVFVSKIAYHHNVYQVDLELYGYYWGMNQSLKSEIWNDSLVYQYYLFKYISKKRPLPVRWIFTKRSQLMTINILRTFIDGTSFTKAKCEVDEKYIREMCGMKNVSYSVFRRKLYTVLFNTFDKTHKIKFTDVPVNTRYINTDELLNVMQVQPENVSEGDKHSLEELYKNAYGEAYEQAYKDAYKEVYKEAFDNLYSAAYETAYKNAYENLAVEGKTYESLYKVAYENAYKDAFEIISRDIEKNSEKDSVDDSVVSQGNMYTEAFMEKNMMLQESLYSDMGSGMIQ